ncbi:MAG: hypothetical protein KJO06_07440 [Gemmatimonadetes bacterium]|nr:hypothetical protein [Gemmatimonadota bacterium]
MIPLRKTLAWSLAVLVFLAVGCDHTLPTDAPADAHEAAFKQGKPTGHEAGNNLSYPVIWAEGVTKALPGTAGVEPVLNGAWWYWWGTTGTDPDITPLSCAPDPEYPAYCDDGLTGVEPTVQPGPSPDLVLAYLQKDPQNIWQAGSADWSTSPVNVHWVDWGDNLESVDWYTRSQVRAEVVLFQDLVTPMTEYQMRHTSGWGIDEVHGLAANLSSQPILGDGTRATVYSPCARFVIQKLLVSRGDPALANLEWVAGDGWTEAEGVEDDLINLPIFNMAVHEAADGPGYYNAEINVKGRIIYGYTWNVRRLNEGAGDYRLTFSFDQSCGTADLNTFFTDGVTEIIVPLEEEIETAAATEGESPGGGGTPELDFLNNLTFIDISIHERGGGGGGSGKKGGGNRK